MRGINKIILLGRLGHEPQIEHTSGGHRKVDLRLATSRPVRTDTGWDEATDWHVVRCWDDLADRVCRVLAKGGCVAVEGQLRTDTWTDAAGQRRARSYVHARRVEAVPRAHTRAAPDQPAASSEPSA